jgi:molybdopterin synthase sulfur carrier subunit
VPDLRVNGADGEASDAVAPARVTLRLFAAAREAAGTGRIDAPGSTVDAVLGWAAAAFGPDFAALLGSCRVWCNGEPAEATTVLADGDEVAVLPPVSGGAVADRRVGGR